MLIIPIVPSMDNENKNVIFVRNNYTNIFFVAKKSHFIYICMQSVVNKYKAVTIYKLKGQCSK